jgi:hypothetical protein
LLNSATDGSASYRYDVLWLFRFWWVCVMEIVSVWLVGVCLVSVGFGCYVIPLAAFLRLHSLLSARCSLLQLVHLSCGHWVWVILQSLHVWSHSWCGSPHLLHLYGDMYALVLWVRLQHLRHCWVGLVSSVRGHPSVSLPPLSYPPLSSTPLSSPTLIPVYMYSPSSRYHH